MPNPKYLYIVYVKRPNGVKISISGPVTHKDALELKSILLNHKTTQTSGTFHLKRILYAKRKVFGSVK